MKMIHSMIRVSDLDQSVQFYERFIELEVNARFEFEGFTLVYMGDKKTGFELELTYNHDGNSGYDLGTGYGHLAVSTDNLEREHHAMKEKGGSPTDIKEFFRDGSLMAKFFFMQDPDGYKIEILQRHGRYI